MVDAGRPHTPDDLNGLGSFSIHLPGESISLSSQSAMPPPNRTPQSHRSPSHTSKTPTTSMSPLPSPDNNRDNVMMALKKLQEKIRQLEVERSAAEGNLRTLAHETTRYKDLLSRERSFKPYEPVQSEVSKNTQELQMQLNCAENRCGLLEKQLDYMRKLVQDSEADKMRLIERSREQESTRIQDDTYNKVKAQKLSEMERDHMKLSVEQKQAEQKIQHLENKLSSEIASRKVAEEKLKSSLSPVMRKPEEKRKLKKKSAPKAKSAKVQGQDSQRLHYHLNLNEMPFLQSKSTSPSHSVIANTQKVLALMKGHNNVMCDKPGIQRVVIESSSSSSSEGDLNELILQLQDEYAQMGFEHKELSAQLAEEENARESEDLERELELLTSKMEIKSEQITQLKRHLQMVERKKYQRKGRGVAKPSGTARSSAPAAERKERDRSAQNTPKTRPVPVTPVAERTNRLQILKDMKKLQTTLRPDDLSWDC